MCLYRKIKYIQKWQNYEDIKIWKKDSNIQTQENVIKSQVTFIKKDDNIINLLFILKI